MLVRSIVRSVIASENKVYTQDPNGDLLFFGKENLINSNEFDLLKEGTLISFVLDENQKISDVKIINEQDQKQNPDLDRYKEPREFLILGTPPLKDYLLIDYGKYFLVKGDRDKEKATRRLVSLCKELGANSMISYEVKEETKNVMGFSFIYYYATAIPAIVANEDPHGDVSLNYLQKKLNKDRISRLGNMLLNLKIGKIVFNVIALVLFIIFAIGFILTM